MPSIKLPCSTANMGAGFDSIGMALTLYNEIEFEVCASGLEIDVGDNQGFYIANDERNLVYRSIKRALEETGVPMPGLRIRQINRIPQTRGLGSSSACVVGGIIAANIVSDGTLSTDDMISIAAEIEGHPDNILPTFIGGMTAGTIVNGKVQYVHIEPPRRLKCCALIPDFPLSTKKARAVLPESVSRADAVFNVSRSALMVGAMIQGRLDLVRTALDDRLHQPYRKQLIPGYDFIVSEAEKNGALGCCLSGAGPTMIAFLDKDYRQFRQRMMNAVKQLEHKWDVVLLDVCYEGATWEL
ncbi:MAG: homoserine kinase [Christensenellales bacterium]|jgi:homoserine kinase